MREDWSAASVVNHALSDATIWQPGSLVTHGFCLTAFGQVKARVAVVQTCTTSCQIIDLQLWPAADHEPYCRHLSIHKIWRQITGLQLLQKAEEDTVMWLESILCSNYSIHEMKWKLYIVLMYCFFFQMWADFGVVGHTWFLSVLWRANVQFACCSTIIPTCCQMMHI